MTINWGDMVINDMANRDENRLREARHLAKADHYAASEAKRPFAGLAQTIRQQFGKPRAADPADATLNLETGQKLG